MQFRRCATVACLLLSTIAASHAQQRTDMSLSEKLQAVLWVQTSLEYPAATRQIYRLAEKELALALANPNRSAAIEQGPNFSAKPPAVILDVDETVLDNSPFNARLARDNGSYTPTAWDSWCNEKSAEPIQGAAHFIRSAKNAGVAIFFVTNRDADVKEVTRQNLINALEMEVPNERLLMKNERPEWTSAKTGRRAHVARDYRIALIVGDDVNDFVRLKEPTPKQRRDLAEHFSANWGHHWILLPNPLYGSWEKALYEYNFGRAKDEKKKLLLDQLQTK